LKILGFPGWSCTQTLEEWFGTKIDVIDHFQQLELLQQDHDSLRGLLPSCEPWVLVTWSMGTLMGLKCCDLWDENPPQFWLALSPFMHFVGKQAANTHEEVMQLKAGLLVKPETALKLFSRGHGVRKAWMDIEATPERVQTLAMSLDTLCQAMPSPKKLLEIPVYAAYGDRDSLVNEWMVHEFVEATGAKLFPALKGVSHAMFYEQPQELAPLFQSCLEG
jgi:hypothetical protein